MTLASDDDCRTSSEPPSLSTTLVVMRPSNVKQPPGGMRKYQHLRNCPMGGITDDVAAQIIAQYGRLVPFVARRFKLPAMRRIAPIDEDDLLAIGHAVLLQSWVDYDPTRGAGFVTWAVFNLQQAFRRLVREARGQAPERAADKTVKSGARYRIVSLADPIVPGGDSAIGDELAAAQFDPTAVFDQERRAMWAHSALASLTERERYVVLAVVNGTTLREVGAQIGKTRQRADQIYKRAIAKMRERAGVTGLLEDDADE